MPEAAGLRVENLGVERGGRAVLRDLSFAVPPGTALFVAGDNGTGKSTLLRALAGLLPRRSGRVALRLGDAEGAPDEVGLGERTHYLGHGNGLKPALTVAENLSFAAAWAGSAGMAPHEALDAVGLGRLAGFPVAVLSAGQRRRAAIARLLVAHRPLWLLDEPATALDAASEATLAALMRNHVARGGLILAAVHAPLAVPGPTLRLGTR